MLGADTRRVLNKAAARSGRAAPSPPYPRRVDPAANLPDPDHIIVTVAHPFDNHAGLAVQRLLDELCTVLGFCLPPSDQARLRQSPPLSPDAFTDEVLRAEGMDPHLDAKLREQVNAVVVRRMPDIVNAFRRGH